MQGDSSWSLGMLIGVPAFCLVLLVCLAVFLWGRFGSDDGAMGGSVVVALIAVVIFAVSWWPFDNGYHRWYRVGGLVSSIDSRLVAGDKSTDQKFVVRFDGSDTQYGCLDTRCASVRPGDQLVIECKREWQFRGTPGWDCNFVSTEPAPAAVKFGGGK